MSFGVLCIFNAVVGIGFGFAFVAAPGPTMAMYGPVLTPGGLLITQLLGAAFIGFGLITFFIRNSKDATAIAAVAFSLVVADTIGGLFCVIGVLGGTVNALGWSSVAIYFLLAAGFGYFRFVKPPA